MPSVIQTAQYILKNRPLLTTMGLERLTFFSQCFYFASHGSLLYSEKSYKHPTSPVSYELLSLHAGKYLAKVEDIGAYEGGLSNEEERCCDWVLGNFGEALWKECVEWDLTGHGELISMKDIEKIAIKLTDISTH